jgi:hypothetical protein
MFTLVMGLIASGVWLAFTIWSQARSDQAHDLYQVDPGRFKLPLTSL